MTKPIRGKVARVLNKHEIAINVGTENGVTVGMYFDIMGTYDEIEDPDTLEVLGSLERPKVRVKIIHVQEKLSLAATYRTKRVNTGGTGKLVALGPFSRALMPPTWVEKYETLGKTEKTKDVLDEKDSYVNVGEPVVQTIEDGEAEGEDTNRT